MLFEINSTTKAYIYALGELQCIVEDGNYQYYYNDVLGSTRFITDDTGVVLQETITSPFGIEVLNAWNDGASLTYRYAGHEQVNSNTGLTYMIGRWMDNETGRFTSPDPARQGINHYVYAGNNPTTNIDPSGMISFNFSNSGYEFSSWRNNFSWSNNFSYNFNFNFNTNINNISIKSNKIFNNIQDIVNNNFGKNEFNFLKFFSSKKAPFERIQIDEDKDGTLDDWSMDNAWVKVKTKDATLPQLAEFITGNPDDWKHLGIDENITKGQLINTAPLLEIFENRVRENVKKTIDTEKNIRFGFLYENLYEDDINSLFGKLDPYDQRLGVDCKQSALLILSKGLIDTLNPGEFSELGLYLNAIGGSSLPELTSLNLLRKNIDDMSEMKTGDMGYIGNYSDYRQLKSSYEKIINYFKGQDILGTELNTSYVGENMIKYSNNLYYGFPLGLKTENNWNNSLKNNYYALKNRVIQYNKNYNFNFINIEKNPQYRGISNTVKFFNIPILAQDIFDLRINKGNNILFTPSC